MARYAELDMPEFNITAKGSLNRLWEIFLAWSVIASGQGSATCYQIVAHKNTRPPSLHRTSGESRAGAGPR